MEYPVLYRNRDIHYCQNLDRSRRTSVNIPTKVRTFVQMLTNVLVVEYQPGIGFQINKTESIIRPSLLNPGERETEKTRIRRAISEISGYDH